MTARELISELTNIVSEEHKAPYNNDFSARQLSNVLTEVERLLGDAIRVAPCKHDGSRWKKSGDASDFCGICLRKVEA